MNREILEIFNDNFVSIGKTSYGEVHNKGLWHQVVHVWLVDPSFNSIIYQKRSPTKKIYPKRLDVSVAGHCRISEKPEDTAEREAMEELGICIEISELFKAGIRRDAFTNGNMINREFQHIFFYKLNFRETKFSINKNELQYIVILKIEDVLNSLINNIMIIGEKYNNGEISKISISPSEFITSIDNYNIKIPIAIKRYLNSNLTNYF